MSKPQGFRPTAMEKDVETTGVSTYNLLFGRETGPEEAYKEPRKAEVAWNKQLS
jgi:hypothetical protein